MPWQRTSIPVSAVIAGNLPDFWFGIGIAISDSINSSTNRQFSLRDFDPLKRVTSEPSTTTGRGDHNKFAVYFYCALYGYARGYLNGCLAASVTDPPLECDIKIRIMGIHYFSSLTMAEISGSDATSS